MHKLFLIRRVVGGSMLPHLVPGRIVLACRFRRLKSGDVVILLHDGLEKIKRVSSVDQDKVYVLGDNSAASTDSRQFGWVERQYVIGRVLWPRV